LREERRLRVFENRVLRRIFGPKRDETKGEWRNYIMRSLMVFIPTQYYVVDKIEMNEMGGSCSANGGGERYVQGIGGQT
jgi:hypothetical protein